MKPKLFIIFLVVLSSCSSNDSNELKVFDAVNESLKNANIKMNSQNLYLYTTLNDKQQDPYTFLKAKFWFSKATNVKNAAEMVLRYVESLESALIKGAEPGNLLVHEKQGEELYSKLQEFRQNLLNIDSSVAEEFKHAIHLLPTPVYSVANQKEYFLKNYLSQKDPVVVLTLLRSLESNVRIVQNHLLSFCNEQVINDAFYYDTWSAIVGQDVKYVKPGEQIEITAGVGAFSTRGQPIVTVNGVNTPLNVYGVAQNKVRASNKVGKHLFPVKFEYTDGYGKKQIVIKDVEYVVVK